MIFVCGLDVASVEVHRRNEVRIADVTRGPGWLVVLWTPDDPATVLTPQAGQSPSTELRPKSWPDNTASDRQLCARGWLGNVIS